MKAKIWVRFTSCLLMLALCVTLLVPASFADAPEHTESKSLFEGENYNIEYSIDGDDIVERFTIYGNEVTRIVRTIHSNNVMDVTIANSSGEISTSSGVSDYSLFYEIYQDQERLKNGEIAPIPSLTGSEVSGSQYKHRYVGTSATDTVYTSNLRKCKSAADIAAILATACNNTPAAVISSTASFIFDQMLGNLSSDCYKLTISSTTYEVLFRYDNSYYTHCYHQTIKEYKSNGTLILSKTDYYQAIGG